MPEREKKAANTTVKAAFGANNRARLLQLYFDGNPSPASVDAWRHVYQLLLWIDGTTGLAHCYESDKTQPGKHWYPRSLAFHSWLAKSFSVAPDALAESVDWLFRRATLDLAASLLLRQDRMIARAKEQREPYSALGFPEPGEDPELVAIIQEVLGAYLNSAPTSDTWRQLVQRVRQHVTLENKRKNLVGEGFEDVLASILARAVPAGTLDVTVRRLLQTVPGFLKEMRGDKPNKADLVVLRPKDGKRILVTAKWSIRADREKQFASEFSSYVNSKSDLKPFEYTLVTNEFDPARLTRACEAMAANARMFTHVVHISTDALLATYGASPDNSMRTTAEFIASGRLLSLGQWIDKLGSE